MRHKILGCILAAGFLFSACSAGGKNIAVPSSEAPPAPLTESSAVPDTVSATETAGAYHKITAEEAKEMIDKGGVTIVDVRRANEYAAGHIPDSILVPNEEIGTEQPEALPDLDAVLLVHCRTGVRSKQASDKLVGIGYKNVYDFGGIVDWPYDVVKEDAPSA